MSGTSSSCLLGRLSPLLPGLMCLAGADVASAASGGALVAFGVRPSSCDGCGVSYHPSTRWEAMICKGSAHKITSDWMGAVVGGGKGDQILLVLYPGRVYVWDCGY